MTPTILLLIVALLCAALSYWRAPLLGVAVILVIAAMLLGGCATDPRTGRTTWDAAATVRVLGAVAEAMTNDEARMTKGVIDHE